MHEKAANGMWNGELAPLILCIANEVFIGLAQLCAYKL